MEYEKQMVKVRLEYEDGSWKEISGPPAQKWIEKVDSAVILQAARGGTEDPWGFRELEEHWVKSDDEKPGREDRGPS